MTEQKLVSEETLSGMAGWELDELRLRAEALGIDPRQVFIDRFRKISQADWDAAERRISFARRKLVFGDASAVALELARNPGPAPPAKTVEDLVALAREWSRAFKWPAGFLPTVSESVLELEPAPGACREWLAGGLSQIAGGHATKLGPRPADPVYPTQEELLRQGDEAAKQQLENRRKMKENLEAGRGMAATEWK